MKKVPVDQEVDENSQIGIFVVVSAVSKRNSLAKMNTIFSANL